MSDAHNEILPGRPAPLGAHLTEGGVNFAIYSSAAEAVELDREWQPADAAVGE